MPTCADSIAAASSSPGTRRYDDGSRSRRNMPPAAPRAFLSPDRMRWIDRWMGVPACWILTVARRLLEALGRPTPAAAVPPRNVVFVELAEMGTTVLAYPAIHRLKALSPDAQV